MTDVLLLQTSKRRFMDSGLYQRPTLLPNMCVIRIFQEITDLLLHVGECETNLPSQERPS